MTVRRNRVFLATCGSLGAVLFATALVGMASRGVVETMHARVAYARRIDALKNRPVNERIIEDEQQRALAFAREYEGAMGILRRINARQPLVDGVFPKPSRTVAAFEFKSAYEAAFDDLSGQLHAGTVPSRLEIESASAELEDLWADRDPGPSPSPVPGHPAPTHRRGAGQTQSRVGGNPMNDARRFAAVMKARSIRCYVGPGAFHTSPIVELDRAPRAAELWFAQVGLWIQQDIVGAIASWNETAASGVDDKSIHVEHVPVKRIEHIRITGYQTPTRSICFPIVRTNASGAKLSEGLSRPASRERFGAFDVVRFSLAVVVDQRDLLRLIDELGRRNLIECVGAEYRTARPDETAEGYLYGTAPIVHARLTCDVYLSRALYRPYMPTDVVGLLDCK